MHVHIKRWDMIAHACGMHYSILTVRTHVQPRIRSTVSCGNTSLPIELSEGSGHGRAGIQRKNTGVQGYQTLESQKGNASRHQANRETSAWLTDFRSRSPAAEACSRWIQASWVRRTRGRCRGSRQRAGRHGWRGGPGRPDLLTAVSVYNARANTTVKNKKKIYFLKMN